ncbi:MAG: nucleotidyl transferase AbiEii/AbiGii toxin family protein [Erysipelotrichales bacterium]|nr:nucleotidyl transferase AbiEii/AbiGii toxin family protein [Erysipelotrichales bacterium]
MYKFAQMTNEDRDFVFNKTAIEKGITKEIVEKDFWVCLMLDFLFTKSKFKEYLTFKGGTSLSKGFNIINRFSEDIDLILDWTVLGVGPTEPLEERSNTKQDNYNRLLNNKAAEFIKNKLLTDIKENLSKLLNKQLDIEIDENDPQVINFYYPRVYESQNEYIKQFVRLEIGPLAARTPSSNVPIVSYACETMSDAFEQKNTLVLTVNPERTFWEKVTILHREANRPQDKQMPQRYARHYYDLYKLSNTEYFTFAMKNRELLEKVVKFKTKFYRDNWAKYDECLNNNIKLIPPDFRIKELEKDYTQMKEMFYGDVPTFTEILERLKLIDTSINNRE